MRACENIFLVYGQDHFKNDQSYFALALFSDAGMVEREHIVRSYESEIDTWKLSNSDERIGPFINLEYLQKFSFSLCQRLDASQIVLLSVDSYNEAVEKSSNVNELMDQLSHHGDILKNIDNDGKKGILDRIFH